jgi:hypothetical protein
MIYNTLLSSCLHAFLSWSLAHPAVEDILDELSIAHIIHLPAQEYDDEVRLFYAFQNAFWMYYDVYWQDGLPTYSFRQFLAVMVERTPGLESLKPRTAVRVFDNVAILTAIILPFREF